MQSGQRYAMLAHRNMVASNIHSRARRYTNIDTIVERTRGKRAPFHVANVADVVALRFSTQLQSRELACRYAYLWEDGNAGKHACFMDAHVVSLCAALVLAPATAGALTEINHPIVAARRSDAAPCASVALMLVPVLFQ